MEQGIRWDDRINPVVIKELRQSVRGRFVPVLLILFLLIQLVSMTMFLSSSNNPEGSELLLVFLGVLMFVMTLLVPLVTAVRITLERSGHNMDLMYVSTLAPRRIVSGKFFAGFIVMLLFFFATLPFMSLTFFLRGVDLPTVFALSVFVLFMGALILHASIVLAYLPLSRVMRVILGLVAVFFMFFITISCISVMWQMVRNGVGASIWSGHLWEESLAFLGLCFSALFVMYRVSEAMVQPSGANRALPVRMGITLISILYIGAGLFLGKDYLEPMIIILSFVGMTALIIAVGEREVINPRLRREIPRQVGLRMWKFPFFSGAVNGTVWAFLFLLALAVLAVAIDLSDVQALIALNCYSVAYALTAHLIYMRFFSRHPKKLIYIILVCLFILTSLCVFAGLYMILGNRWDSGTRVFFLLNPVYIIDARNVEPAVYVSCLWALGVTLLRMPWLIKGAQNFKPFPSSKEPS